MGIYEGLDKIKQYQDEIEARRDSKIVWFSSEVKDGESVKVRFLQELDRGAEGYNEDNGLGIMVTEHSNPNDWHRKALCSMDEEGKCLGCEKHREEGWKAGWGQKSRLIINVLIERKNGDRSVAVMSQANGSKAVIAPMILESAVSNNTLTDRWWKFTRQGEGTKTNWIPFVYSPDDDVDVTEYDVFDVRKAVREIPYDEQFDHYFKGASTGEDSEKEDKPAPSKGSTTPDEEW